MTDLTTLWLLPHSFTRRCQPKTLSYCITDYVHSESTSFLSIRCHKTPDLPVLSSLSLSLSFFCSSSSLTKLLGTAEKSGIQPRSPSHRAFHHRYVHPTTKTSTFPTSKDPFISQNYPPNLNPTS
jgi:hypothetical protein